MDIGTIDNVVSLSTRRPMAPGALREVEAYWMALADGRLMPKRSEVDPRGLTGALDRVFLLEKIAPSHARFRVAGSRLSRLLEMDLRGMPVSALFHPTARPDLADTLAAVFADPARVHLRLDGAGGLFWSRVPAEMLILPLRDDLGEVTRALGVIDWEGDVQAPNRFRIGHQERRTLIGYGARPDASAADMPVPVLDDRVPASELELVPLRDVDPAGRPVPPLECPDKPPRPTLTLVT